MNVLAFDTCLGAVSVAVRWRDARGEWQEHGAIEMRARGHAERLMPMIAEVMKTAGLSFPRVHRIAVTVGPGSFTGVRTGVAAARGLALAAGIPVIGATSLAVMAEQAFEALAASRRERPLAVAADARRDMVYVQAFAGPRQAATQALVATPEDAAAAITSGPVLIVGWGAKAVAEATMAAGGDAEAALPELQPDARALARLAEALLPVSPLRPLYLRAPDAKPPAGGALARAVP